MVDKDNGEFLAVHEEVVKKVLETLPDEEELYDLAELFKVFGDSTRIRILHALFESELCVGDIAQILNLSQSAVSHQLKLLKLSLIHIYVFMGENNWSRKKVMN